MAATFALGGRALRLAARPGLRSATNTPPSCEHPAHVQDAAYHALDDAALFTVRDGAIMAASATQHRGQVVCAGCGEDVAVAFTNQTDVGPCCVPCASTAPVLAVR